MFAAAGAFPAADFHILAGGMPVDPRELTLLVTGTANALYDSLPAEDLAVLAAVLTQLGDTLATLAVQRERLNDGRGEEK